MIKKYTTNSVKEFLPPDLIEYLFDLAENYSDTDIQAFRLKPYTENERTAQLIDHTIFLPRYSKDYLAGTYLTKSELPLDAKVSVYCDETSCNLSLAKAVVPAYEREVMRIN